MIWRPDPASGGFPFGTRIEVIVNGDLVSRGPYSLECLRLLQTRFPQAHYLTGNHETYVLRCADEPADPDSPTRDIDRFADWALRQLGDAVDELRAAIEEYERRDGYDLVVNVDSITASMKN